MKEATYLSCLSTQMEQSMGGKAIKISDRSTLGLPDSMYIKSGIVMYLEAKIGEEYLLEDGKIFVQPWKIIKKDLRQYEVCRDVAKHALLVYAIYWPKIKTSAVLTIDQCQRLRPETPDGDLPWLNNPIILQQGYGLKRIKNLISLNNKEIYGRLDTLINGRRISETVS